MTRSRRSLLGGACGLCLLAVAPSAARADAQDLPGPQPGFLLAAALGVDLLGPVGQRGDAGSMAWSLRFGSRFRTGVSAAFGYDNLELRPYGVGIPLQVVSSQVRYTFFNLSPEPYGELLGGLALVSANGVLKPGGAGVESDIAVAVGGGATFELNDHLALQLGARAYATPAVGTTLEVFTLQLGVEVDLDAP